MCTYFKTEIDVAQNPLDEFFSNFDWQKTFPQEGFQVKKNKGVRGYFLKKNKRKFCMQNLTKERKQPPVVILQQAIFYNIFISWLWLRIIRRSDQGVYFMNFPSKRFFNDINHGCRAAILKKNFLWLLPFYMAVATYCYYGKVRRTIRNAIVSYLLKYWLTWSEANVKDDERLCTGLSKKASYFVFPPKVVLFEILPCFSSVIGLRYSFDIDMNQTG